MSIRTKSEWSPFNRIGQYNLLNSTGYTQLYFPKVQSLRQETASEGHRMRKGKWIEGGPFNSRRVEVIHSPGFGTTTQGGTSTINRRVQSLFFVDSSSATSLALPGFQSALTVGAIGTKGIAVSSPTTPQAGLGQALAELKDCPRLPDVRRLKDAVQRQFRATPRNMRNKSFLNQSGDEYLNFVFGWMPLFKDLHDLYEGLRDHQKNADQLRRNSGRKVRRKRTVLNETTTSSTTVNQTFAYGYPALVTQFYQDSFSVLSTDIQTSTRGWFSGAFTYFLPPKTNSESSVSDRIREHLTMLRILYGVEVTPSILWELTPWSWLADWSFNLGDNIRNLSNFLQDGLVLHYGYAMMQVESVTQQRRTFKLAYGGSSVSANVTKRTVTSQRVGASPYGFGWNPSSATARQGAIIAALAASKA